MSIINQAHSVQIKKIRALWAEASKAGLAKNADDSTLTAYVNQQTSAKTLQSLTRDQACLVIEALKKWLGRQGSK